MAVTKEEAKAYLISQGVAPEDAERYQITAMGMINRGEDPASVATRINITAKGKTLGDAIKQASEPGETTQQTLNKLRATGQVTGTGSEITVNSGNAPAAATSGSTNLPVVGSVPNTWLIGGAAALLLILLIRR